MAHYALTSKIIELSESNKWEQAKREWKLVDVFREEDPDTCLCGHYPILENCILQNTENGNTALVGNVCVKKFMEHINSHLIFQAINRVIKDDGNALNGEAIAHARQKGWISQWEWGFYCDTMRKRELSAKQYNTRVQINKKVLRAVVRNRPKPSKA